MLLTSSDTKRTHETSILVYKFRPERTGFNVYAKYTTANNFPCITPLPHSKHIYDVSEIRIKGTVSVISSDPYFCLIVFKGPYISVKISEFLSLKETLIVYYENLNRIICRILKYFFQNNCFKNLDKNLSLLSGE